MAQEEKKGRKKEKEVYQKPDLNKKGSLKDITAGQTGGMAAP